MALRAAATSSHWHGLLHSLQCKQQLQSLQQQLVGSASRGLQSSRPLFSAEAANALRRQGGQCSTSRSSSSSSGSSGMGLSILRGELGFGSRQWQQRASEMKYQQQQLQQQRQLGAKALGLLQGARAKATGRVAFERWGERSVNVQSQGPLSREPVRGFHVAQRSTLPHGRQLMAGKAVAPHTPWLRSLHSSQWQAPTRRFSSLPPDSVLYGLLATNAAVFVAWQLLPPSFMQQHFTVSLSSLQHGRVHTLITAGFSQQDFWHLATNMMGLYFFGQELGRLYGQRFLLQLYLSAALVSSLAHLAYQAYTQRRYQRQYGAWYYSPYASLPALGASGSVNAIVLFSCLLYPTRIIYLNFFLPLPAILLGAAFVLHDLWGTTKESSTVGHAAHLGGAAVGVLAWFLKRRPRGW